MTSLTTADGIELEARWDDATDRAKSVTVLCHPHPLHGGTMRVPLLDAIASQLTGRGAHVLRFNFRGVGRSEGSWAGGTGERADVAAAVEAATIAFPELEVGLAGWSFGATMSLDWQAATGSTLRWVGVAPGIAPYAGAVPPDPTTLLPADRLVILGERDQLVPLSAATDYAARLGAKVEVLPGADHFFYLREDVVARLVADHFCPV